MTPSDLIFGPHFRFLSHYCPGIMSTHMRSTVILEFDLPQVQNRPKNYNYMNNVLFLYRSKIFLRANRFCVCVAGQWGQPC